MQDQPSGWSCRKVGTDFEPERNKIVCPLGDTIDILFDPDFARQQQFLRKGPRKAIPETLEEQTFNDWLLRMSNVERVAGHVRPWGELEQLVGARIVFGWADVQTCALDGGESNEARLFRFKGQNDDGSDLLQPLAEGMRFTSGMSPGPLTIILHDRSSGRREFIRADCGKAQCLTLWVDN